MPSWFFIPALAIAVALSTVRPAGHEPAAASAAPAWHHPVDAPVVDQFRPPSSRFGPGNRGLEYDTEPGQPVMAVADGEVVFAGRVAGHRFVVIAHDPELRSTYAYLERIDVVVGQGVAQGQVIAGADVGFHLTARRAGRYIDPLLFLGRTWSVRLVAVPVAGHQATRGGPQ